MRHGLGRAWWPKGAGWQPYVGFWSPGPRSSTALCGAARRSVGGRRRAGEQVLLLLLLLLRHGKTNVTDPEVLVLGCDFSYVRALQTYHLATRDGDPERDQGSAEEGQPPRETWNRGAAELSEKDRQGSCLPPPTEASHNGWARK